MKYKVDLFKENDLELLDRIRQNDELALDVMLEKYKPLIVKKINQYMFPKAEIGDYIQEGYKVLLKAIDTYRDDYSKTFTRYFELLLTNRFNTLYKKSKNDKTIIIPEEEIVDDASLEVDDYIDLSIYKFSKFENQIYDLYFNRQESIDQICDELNVQHKQVYNSIQRIKKKISSSNLANK